MFLTVIKNANAVLAFLLELGVLVALGYWGFQSGRGMISKVGYSIAAPIGAAVVWGLFGAPSATWPLHEPWFFILQVLFFGSASLALFATGRRALSIGFGLALVINLALYYTLGSGNAF